MWDGRERDNTTDTQHASWSVMVAVRVTLEPLEPLEPLELTPLLQHCEHYAKYLMCFRIVHAAASWCRYYRKTKKNAIDICDHYNETYETGILNFV